MTQNKHIEHPEDTILTGDLTALDWFLAEGNLSVKIDGAPAIVWGRNPATGNFFVGTKSVFNKVKIKINESHAEIDQNHTGEVAKILHACFDWLPHTDAIFQGDFIGFGGESEYTPNTITYDFGVTVREEIIVAPHTYYTFTEFQLKNAKELHEIHGNVLGFAVANPMLFTISDTAHCKFVQPDVELHPYREDLGDVCKFAKQMAMLCDFVSARKATEIKKAINECIREGYEVDEDEIAEKCDCDVNVLRLWKLVASIKDDLFCFIQETDDIGCLIGEEVTLHEGYVITNQFGMFKVVDRYEFSRANFTIAKNWG